MIPWLLPATVCKGDAIHVLGLAPAVFGEEAQQVLLAVLLLSLLSLLVLLLASEQEEKEDAPAVLADSAADTEESLEVGLFLVQKSHWQFGHADAGALVLFPMLSEGNEKMRQKRTMVRVSIFQWKMISNGSFGVCMKMMLEMCPR